MTLDDLERQNRDFLMDFSGHFRLWEFISFTRWRHAADATRAYGRSVLWSRGAESKWYAIFETITTELEML